MLLAFLLLLHTVFAHSDGPPHDHPELTPAVTESSPSATTIPSQIPTPTIDPIQQKIDQYTKDYQYARDVYSQAYLEYTNKKQVHTQYGTIITETEKLKATRAALIARNNMMRTYLLALRVKLDKYSSVALTETEKQKIDLNKWEAWFEEQNTVVTSLISATDFAKNAEEFKGNHILIRRVISTALVQNQINISKYTAKQIEPVTAEIATSSLAPEGQQLLSEIRIKLDLSEKSLKTAFAKTTDNLNSFGFNDFYPESKTNLVQAKDYLVEVINNIEGILIRFSSSNQ